MKKPKFDSNVWLWEQAAKAAGEWYALQCRNLHAYLYLYFKRGELTVAEDPPAGFTLGSGQRIGPMGTRDAVRNWIYDNSRRLACLPEVES